MGAPLALAGVRFDAYWLFTLGVGVLLVALALPTRPGQTPLDKVRAILSHLPGIGWLGHRRSSDPLPDDRRS